MPDMKYNKHHGGRGPEGRHGGHKGGRPGPGGPHGKGPHPHGRHKARKHSQWRDVWYRLTKNKLATAGMILAALLVLVAILAPILTPYDPEQIDATVRFAPLSLKHLCGTDNYGRDLLTRLLYGARTSLLVAALALVLSFAVAIVFGLLAGYFGGVLETIIMRLMDILMSIPSVLLAISISSALGAGIWPTAIAIAITGIAMNVRLLRATVLTVRIQEYVEAAKATGSSSLRIMFHEILPNCLSPLIVQFSMGIGGNITTIAGLSFIGLGVRPPIAEWGNIMTTGLSYIRQYWPMAVFPGIMIMITLFAFNCFGEGLRDAMDPKLKR